MRVVTITITITIGDRIGCDDMCRMRDRDRIGYDNDTYVRIWGYDTRDVTIVSVPCL